MSKVYNLLLVEGSIDDRADISPDDFELEKLIPEPEEFKPLYNKNKLGKYQEYELIQKRNKWRDDNWGCNYYVLFDVKDLTCMTEVKLMSYTTIPDKWCEKVSLLYPRAKLKLISKLNQQIIITEYSNNKQNQQIYNYNDNDWAYINDTYYRDYEN